MRCSRTLLSRNLVQYCNNYELSKMLRTMSTSLKLIRSSTSLRSSISRQNERSIAYDPRGMRGREINYGWACTNVPHYSRDMWLIYNGLTSNIPHTKNMHAISYPKENFIPLNNKNQLHLKKLPYPKQKAFNILSQPIFAGIISHKLEHPFLAWRLVHLEHPSRSRTTICRQ